MWALLGSCCRENPERAGLLETPGRVVRAWEFWTKGYRDDPASILKTFEDGAADYDQMVVQCGVRVYSNCEHHMAPFWGEAHIGYIPNGRIVGLSKLQRLVDCFSRRLQVQERITTQIVDALQEHLKPKGAGVILRCRHMCMESRGVQVPGTVTITSALSGEFANDPTTRNEFLALRQHSKGIL